MLEREGGRVGALGHPGALQEASEQADATHTWRVKQQQQHLERPSSQLQLQQRQQQQQWDARDVSGAMARLVECGAVLEASVDECGFPVPSAFNDLGLHCFPLDWRQRLAAAAGGPAAQPRVAVVK